MSRTCTAQAYLDMIAAAAHKCIWRPGCFAEYGLHICTRDWLLDNTVGVDIDIQAWCRTNTLLRRSLLLAILAAAAFIRAAMPLPVQLSLFGLKYRLVMYWRRWHLDLS